MAKYKRTDFSSDIEEDDDITNTEETLEQEGGQQQPGQGHGVGPKVTFQQTPEGSFWSQRTILEKFLLFFCLFLFLAAVIMMTMIIIKSESEVDYCLTTNCVKVSSQVLESMDLTADPCQDFYQYTCGGWIESNPIPDGQTRWGTFGLLGQKNQLVIKNALDKPMNDTQAEAIKKSKLFYTSCMDEGRKEELGVTPLLKVIQELGGWGLDGNWTEDSFNLTNLLFMAQYKYLVYPFFGLWVGTDDKNSTNHLLKVDQSGLVLPGREYYLNKTDDDKVLSFYLQYMVKMGRLITGLEDDKEVNITSQMMDVLELEKQIAQITIPADQRRDGEKLYHKLTLEELQNKYAPFLNWTEYIQNFFVDVENVTITEEELIDVVAPDYMTKVTTLLNNNRTSRTFNNYIVWQVVLSLTDYLNKEIREASDDLNHELYGISSHVDAWRSCIYATERAFGFALGALFVNETFHGESKENAEKMVGEVKESFEAGFGKLTWMDPETGEAAKEKADAIVDLIGFPEYILNNTLLDSLYTGINVTSDEYFWNHIRVMHYNLPIAWGTLRKPVAKHVWEMTPQTVNAYYQPTANEIVFPAGILQLPFYQKNLPSSLNLGGIGVVIGHEITHGFDDSGREYDKDGNLRPWWNNQTVEEFKEKTQCMVDKYSKYCIDNDPDLCINGQLTLGENIADNGGLKAAYHAYEDWVSKHGKEQPLPGIPLTHKQLFFVGFAQVWCESSTKAYILNSLLNDPHSPGRYRVIGSLSNFAEFASEFKCASGSYMNPETKCEVW